MSWTHAPSAALGPRRLIAHGEAVGGPEHLVLAERERAAGDGTARDGPLTTSAAPTWREHFDTCMVRALEEESNLQLVGRLLARTDDPAALCINRLRAERSSGNAQPMRSCESDMRGAGLHRRQPTLRAPRSCTNSWPAIRA